MGYSIFSHSHLHLVGCETNGQRRMVLVNLQKAFGILNHTILMKKMYPVGFSVTHSLGFLVWVVALFTSLQVSIKNKFFNVASTNCEVAQQSRGFPCWGSPTTSQTFAHSPTGKSFPSWLPHDHHQIFILCHHQRLISPTK